MTLTAQITIAITAACLAPFIPAQAQQPRALFVLCGTYGISQPASLYRVDSGEQRIELQVGGISPDGLDSVFVDYDRGKIVAASPPLTPKTFSIIDMKTASLSAPHSISYDAAELTPAGSVYLLDVPGRGLTAALGLMQGWKEPYVFPRALTAVALSGNGTNLSLPLEDIEYIHLSGYPGGALEIHPVEARGDPIHILIADPKGWSTGTPAPQPATATNPQDYFMLINDARMAVLVQAHAKTDVRTFDVLDKTNNTWRHVSAPVPFRQRLRSFENWVAVTSESIENNFAAGDTTLRSKATTSPGRETRLAEAIDDKNTIEDQFSAADSYFPGELWIYNLDDSRQLRISTGQGDSEVLLIAEDKVYYRVNDSIFVAEVTPTGLGPSALVAEGAELAQAHWAFLSSASPLPPALQSQ